MTLPLYRGVGEKPPKRDSAGHAGLWFDKFCDRWQISSVSWSMSGNGNPKTEWLKTLTQQPVGANHQIQEYALRVVRLVENFGGTWMVLSSQSRFVTGLGRSHPVENGFAWHPTLGVPYLPGGSVKGMVRAWTRVDADPVPDSATVARMFGGPDDAGSLCFLDAVPIGKVSLEIDVMTPHYAQWTVDKPPGDWRSPTPIPFLVTASKTPLLFGIVPRRPGFEKELSSVEGWLREALEQAGAGAKTAVGYGRFEPDGTNTAKLRKRFDRTVREQEERIDRERKLASLSPVEQEIEELIHGRRDPDMPEITAIYKAIQGGRWSGEEKIKAARWLKSRMQGQKKWKPTTRAKKPEKDKDHQRTRRVREWLSGR